MGGTVWSVSYDSTRVATVINDHGSWVVTSTLRYDLCNDDEWEGWDNCDETTVKFGGPIRSLLDDRGETVVGKYGDHDKVLACLVADWHPTTMSWQDFIARRENDYVASV